MFAVNNSSSMWSVSGCLCRWNRLLFMLLIAAPVVVLPCRASADHNENRDGNGNGQGNGNGRGHRDPSQFSGTFTLVVRGYFVNDPSNTSGNTASVSQTAVTIQWNVKDDSGHGYTLAAANLRISDNYHFSGTGTVGGIQVTIDGHVDPSDPAPAPGNNGRGEGHNRQVVSHTRLECTYTTSDPATREHHSGRIVGTQS